MKTTKLSKLQKGILKAALSMHWHRGCDNKEGFLSSEQIGEIFFGIPPLSSFRKKRDRYWNPEAYREKRKIHNRVDASISRSLTKLQERGLVEKWHDGYGSGCRLTSSGLKVARSLVPPHLTGPTKQDLRELKARGKQAQIEEQKSWERMISAINRRK